MSLRTWHTFALDTGLFTGQSVSYSANTYAGADPENGETTLDAFVRAQIPDGFAAIEGVSDWRSQRVDLATGSVVDYQPPAPSIDHVWDAVSRRWRLTDAASAAIDARDSASRAIADLERQSLRALREHILGDPAAADRLRQIDARIAAQRGALSK